MPEKTMFAKNENDHEMSQSQKGTMRKKQRIFKVLAAFCYNLKFLYRF